MSGIGPFGVVRSLMQFRDSEPLRYQGAFYDKQRNAITNLKLPMLGQQEGRTRALATSLATLRGILEDKRDQCSVP